MTTITTTTTNLIVAGKSHPNRVLFVNMESIDGKRRTVSVRKAVLGGEWTPEEIEAVKVKAQQLYKGFRKYKVDEEIDLYDEDDKMLPITLMVNRDEDELIEQNIAVYRAVTRHTGDDMPSFAGIISERLASEERITEIKALIDIVTLRQEDEGRTTYFDSFTRQLAQSEDVGFINILESDYNGTGYLDHLATARLPGSVGTRYIGLDRHNRRVIVIQGRDGNNIVLFERYSPDNTTGARVVSNTTPMYKSFIANGVLGEDAFHNALDLIDNLTSYEAHF